MKKWFYLILIGVLAGGGYFAYNLYQTRQATAASDYLTVPAGIGDLTATVGATGVVRANQTAILTWQTSGTIQDVNISLGDQVSITQVLATLEETSLLQSVILAQADLASAQNALENLDLDAETARVRAMQSIATYEQAVRDAQYQLDNFTVPTNQQGMTAVKALDMTKEKLDLARAAFEPYKFRPSGDTTRQRLKEALDTTQSDYNAAVKRLDYEYNLEVAQANLTRARQDYSKWENGPVAADVEAAEARIAAAQATIKLKSLAAPFHATVTEVKAKPGDQVTPGTPAFRLDDFSRLLVDVSVSEVDINRVALGQPVNLTFDAILGHEYHGVVSEVAPVGITTQGVVDFNVTVELSDADENVRPGMTAAVNIVINQLKDVLLTPNRAVRLQNGKRVVYVLRDGVPTPIIITLGASSDTTSEVINGDLKVNDPIVLNPPIEFESGGPPPFMR